MPIIVQIDAYDPVAAAPATLRMASDDDAAVCHLNGQVWWPVLDKLPVLAMDFFGGEFGQVTTAAASLSLAVEPWPDFARYAFPDARLQIWHGDAGAVWAGYTLRFDGRVTAQPVIEDGRAQIGFAVDDKWLDTPMLATYAGTGGAEGPSAMKGTVKPIAIGAPMGVPGVMLDPVKSILQLSAYGAIESVDVPLERLARQFGSPIADYATYAALDAAAVPAGQWATAKAVGLVKMGAPPYGKLCFLMKGDKGGVDGWVRRPGAIIKRYAGLSGGAAKVSEAAVDALDAARPYDMSVYYDGQVTAREAIQEIAASVNAVAGVSLTGQLIVVPIQINATGLTLRADGSSLPIVGSVRALGISAPWWRLAIGAQPFFDVHGQGEYATDTTPEAGATNDANLDNPTQLIINEKIRLIPSENARAGRKVQLRARMVALGLSVSALDTAEANWLTYRDSIAPSWSDTGQHSTINRTTWNSLTVAYDAALDAGDKAVSEEDAKRANWDAVSGSGKPENNATVGSRLGVNTLTGGGTLLGGPDLLNIEQQWADVQGAAKPADNATTSDNLIKNGSILDGAKHWLLQDGAYYQARPTGEPVPTAIVFPAGAGAKQARANDGQRIPADGATRIWASGWSFVNVAGAYFRAGCYPSQTDGNAAGAGYVDLSIIPTAVGVWQSFKVAIDLPASTTHVIPYIYTAGNPGDFMVGGLRFSKTEPNATVGARAGDNLLDAGGATLTDSAIKNSLQLWNEVNGTGKPQDNATLGARAGINLLDGGGSALTDSAIKNSLQLWNEVSGAGRPADNATVGAIAGTNLVDVSGNPITHDSVRNNLALIDWWKEGASLPWSLNGGGNAIFTYNRAGYPAAVTGPQGFDDDCWYCYDADGDAGGGWNGAPHVPLNQDKTYRFVIPVMRLSGGDTGVALWGPNDCCTLNTTTPDPNPYFTGFGRVSMVTNRWYLMIGYLYPRNSTNKSNTSAGVWDTVTGAKVSGGTNFCFRSGQPVPMTRAYQYYVSGASEMLFGKPRIECYDGTESSLREYFRDTALLNNQQRFDDIVGGFGKPEANADVTITAQVTPVKPDDVTINADYLGAILPNQFNKIVTPSLTRGGVSVRTDNRASYTLSNVTGGLVGFVSVNNTNGSADKGRYTITDCPSSGTFQMNIFWDGVLVASYVMRVTVTAANPPLGGGGSGGTKSGSVEIGGQTVSSTSFVSIAQINNLTKAAGETIKCNLPAADYELTHTATSSRNVIAKFQYSPTGANSWTDMGTQVSGTVSYWDAIDVSSSPGSITVYQTVAPSNGAFDVRLVVARNASGGGNLNFTSGIMSVIIEP